MNRFEWSDAKTVEQALAQLGPGTVLKAGGVDVMDLLKEGLISPSRLVNLRNIQSLDRIVEGAGAGLALGPLVTLARLASEPLISKRYAAMAQAAGQAATPQIRNMATVGGNLLQRPRCWYFRSEAFHCLRKAGPRCFAIEGENSYHAIFGNQHCAIVHPSAMATVLVAFGSKLKIRGPKQSREVLLESFYVSPETDVTREHSLSADEILTEIHVPPEGAQRVSAYTKQGEKESFDWPVAECCVVLELSGKKVQKASLVLGAAAPVPYRAHAAEKILMGNEITEDIARDAARAALESATPLSQNQYKVPMFLAIVRRTILAAASQ